MNKKLERLLNENQNGNPSYTALKKQSNELADILEYTEFKKWCGRIRASGEYIKISIDENGKNKISKQVSGIRSEPLTANLLQKKTWAQFNKNAPLLIEKYPNHIWLFITLTIPSCDINNLRDKYKYLNRVHLNKRHQSPIGFILTP
jgi:hypothetical protein